MVDWKLWRFIFFTAFLEIIIAVIVAVILIIYFPLFTIYIILGTIIILAIYIWISYYIYKPVATHQQIDPQDEMKGQLGITITDLTPRGQVKIRSRVWSARSIAGFVQSGMKIKVIQMDGIILKVEPMQE